MLAVIRRFAAATSCLACAFVPVSGILLISLFCSFHVYATCGFGPLTDWTMEIIRLSAFGFALTALSDFLRWTCSFRR